MALPDLAAVSGFDWDSANLRKNVRHGVSPSEAEEAFADPALLIIQDTRHSQVEARFHALGRSRAGRTLHLTFTLRKDGTRVRVISMRPMSRKERELYETQDRVGDPKVPQ